MATYIWAGSTAHKGGYGHTSWTGGTDNDNYLSGVTHGFYWNDPRNWLEEFQGICGGVSGGSTGDAVYYGHAQDVPAAGDTVILKELVGGEYVGEGPGVGVTGTFPKAPLLFGGYVPSTNTDAGLINNYPGGGGWIGATAAGKTSGKLTLFKVENSYLNDTLYGYSHESFVGRFPVGVKGDDIKRIEEKTKNKTRTGNIPRNTWSIDKLGGTFSGVQIKTESFIHEGLPNTDFVWDSGNSGGAENNFSINLIHSVIDFTKINGFNAFYGYGVTFDQLFIERENLPKSKWDLGGGDTYLSPIPENSIMTGRPHVGCRVINHANGTGYLRIGGFTGGQIVARLDETVPKIDVTTNYRRHKIYIDASTITTLNLYPEGSGGVSLRPHLAGYGEHQPVVLQPLDSRIVPLASYTRVTTCNLEDSNPVYGGIVAGSDIWFINSKNINVRGTENRLGINKGVTFDNLNIKGGRVYIGELESNDESGSDWPPTDSQPNGTAIWDIGQVRVTDGELHTYVYLNCNHPQRTEWNNFEIGGCVSPCTKAGFKIISNGNVVKWNPGMYVVADSTSKGSTGGISLSRWSASQG